MKRFCFMLLVFAMSLCVVCLPASAADIDSNAENIPVVDTVVDTAVDTAVVEPRAETPPTAYYNLSQQSGYTATLIDLAASKGSYTLYYFSTGSGRIFLKCDFIHSGTSEVTERSMKIVLYRMDPTTFVTEEADSCEFEYDTPPTTVRRMFSGLDANYFYYIRFVNTSNTSTGSGEDISANILIDDVYS